MHDFGFSIGGAISSCEEGEDFAVSYSQHLKRHGLDAPLSGSPCTLFLSETRAKERA